MTLNVKKVNKLSQPGRYGDGGGLYAQVTTTGRSWVFRYELRGAERWMGLGPLRDFTLDEARERARKARRLLKDGTDPLDAKWAERAARAVEAAKRIDFETAARDYFKGHEQKWSNAEHRRQFLSSLQDFAFPQIGKIPVAQVDTPAVLEVLKPIWYDKTVTAGRVRNRIEAVLDWATASGYRTGPNPAAWAGHLEAILPAKAKIAKVKHHAALPYADIPDFVAALATRKGIEAKALAFLILTAARSGEVINARRSEIDFVAKVWTVPADRMKARKEHRVPLPDRALAILKALPTEGDFIFPGARKGRPLGKMAMANLIDAMERDVTVHGFRSSFRDFAAERTNFPREIIEQCLAHSVGNAVEQSYLRTDVLEKRRKLMAMWSSFCTTPKRDATVTPIRKRKAA
jgi:integrase